MPTWKRSFAALWFANWAAATGMWAMVPYLTYTVEELGVDDPDLRNLWAGILVAAAPIVAALMGPVWGGIGDRFGRKAMILRALGGIVLFVGLMALVGSPWTLLLLRLLQGLFSGFVAPSITLVTLMVPLGRSGPFAGLMQGAAQAGAVTGYALGGFVHEAGPMQHVFPICSGLAFLGFLLVLFFVRELEPPVKGASKSPKAIWSGMVGDYRYVLGLNRLVRVLFCVVIVRFSLSLLDPHFARFLDELGGADARPGWTFAGEAILLLIFMPIWGRVTDRIGPSRVLAISCLGLAACALMQGLAQTHGWLVSGRVLRGAALAGIFPASYGMAAKESSMNRRGSSVGMVFLALALSHALGAVAGGLVINAVGWRAVLLVSGCLFVLLAAFSARGAKPMPT